jgi:type IV secretory pathway VirB2 component (pilin)
VGIGIALGAFSLIFGSRDGMQRTIMIIIGAVLLFSARTIVNFIQSATH